MDVNVTVRHGSISDEAVDVIRQKATKLTRFYDRVTQVEVVVDVQKMEHPEVEIKVCAERHDDFFAKDDGNNVLSAVESVVRKLEQQIKKYKEKLTDQRHKPDVVI